MAKLKLKLSSKPEEDVGAESPKITIKPLKSKKTVALPKIKLKTPSSTSTPDVKFKTLETGATTNSFIPDTEIKLKTPKIKVKPAKLPGNGYDSEDPDREEDPLVEEAIVVRFLPDENLDIVRSDESQVSITWKDKRRAVVSIGDALYAAKLVNLPTVSEVHKSVDRKNLYKTVDVSQMLLVVKRISDRSEISSLKVDKEAGETYPDGLTTPMEGIKEKFDKKYETLVIQNVEDEVAKLLKMDEEAESSVFEFIDAEEENLTPVGIIEDRLRNKRAKKEKKKRKREMEKQQRVNQQSSNLPGISESGSVLKDDEELNLNDQFEDIDDELDRLMEEGGKEDDAEEGDEDDDDEDDDDDEEEEEEEEEVEEEEIDAAPTPASVKAESDDEDDEDDEDDDDVVGPAIRNGDGEADEVAQHSALLHEEISELESTIAQKEKDLAKAFNPIMKNRITDVISRLQQELEMKRTQVAEVDAEKKREEDAKTISGNTQKNANQDAEEGEEEEEEEEEAEDVDVDVDEKNDETDDNAGAEEDEDEDGVGDKDTSIHETGEDNDEDEYDDLF
ncbi:unnamed protein product [Pichia kudriavzevii]